MTGPLSWPAQITVPTRSATHGPSSGPRVAAYPFTSPAPPARPAVVAHATRGHPLPVRPPPPSAWRAPPHPTTARCSVSLVRCVQHRYFRRPSTPPRGPTYKDTVAPRQARSLGARASLFTCPLDVSLAIACHRICFRTPPFIGVRRLTEHVSPDKAASHGACGTRPTALPARPR